MQAGREIRVIADSHRLGDEAAAKLCRDIAKAVQEQLTYPGEVKVTVLREMRSVEFAEVGLFARRTSMSEAILKHIRELAMTLTPEEQLSLIGDLAAKLRKYHLPRRSLANRSVALGRPGTGSPGHGARPRERRGGILPRRLPNHLRKLAMSLSSEEQLPS